MDIEVEIFYEVFGESRRPLKSLLKIDNEGDSLISSGISSQIFGPLTCIEFSANLVFRTRRVG